MRAAGSLLDEFAGHVLVLIELLRDRASVTDVHRTRASGPRKSDRRPRCRNNERSCAAVVSLRRGGEEASLLLSRKTAAGGATDHLERVLLPANQQRRLDGCMWVQLADLQRQLLLRDTRTDLTAPKGRLRRPAADDSRGRELEPAVAPQNGKRPRARPPAA